MAARAAVKELITQDPVLGGSPWYLDDEKIWDGWTVEKANRSGYLLIIRWQEFYRAFTDYTTGTVIGKDRVEIWGYVAATKSRAFTQLDTILARVEKILLQTTHYKGSDGWIMTAAASSTASLTAHGPDVEDTTYTALSKNLIMDVVSRKAP